MLLPVQPTPHLLCLQDANAYMDCEVSSDFEAGDHRVVYAIVKGAKVLQDASLTAVHHRKVGNHY